MWSPILLGCIIRAVMGALHILWIDLGLLAQCAKHSNRNVYSLHGISTSSILSATTEPREKRTHRFIKSCPSTSNNWPWYFFSLFSIISHTLIVTFVWCLDARLAANQCNVRGAVMTFFRQAHSFLNSNLKGKTVSINGC